MFDSDYDFTFRDFLSARGGTSSDISYVLRKTLQRGIKEAEYRHRLYDGDKAFDYKRTMYEFEAVLDGLDTMLGADGRICDEDRVTIMKVLKLCKRLTDLDRVEANADYYNLVSFLTADLCEGCRAAALAA
jgi:hypothetical protein